MYSLPHLAIRSPIARCNAQLQNEVNTSKFEGVKPVASSCGVCPVVFACAMIPSRSTNALVQSPQRRSIDISPSFDSPSFAPDWESPISISGAEKEFTFVTIIQSPLSITGNPFVPSDSFEPTIGKGRLSNPGIGRAEKKKEPSKKTTRCKLSISFVDIPFRVSSPSELNKPRWRSSFLLRRESIGLLLRVLPSNPY